MAYASLTEINRGWQLVRLLLIQHSQAWTITMTTREDMMFDTHWPTSPVFFSSSVSQWKYFVFGSSCNERQLWAHTRQHMFHQTGRKGSAHVDIDALGKYTHTHTRTLTQHGGIQQRQALKSACSQVGNSLVAVPTYQRRQVIAARRILVSVRWGFTVGFVVCVCAFFCVTDKKSGALT